MDLVPPRFICRCTVFWLNAEGQPICQTCHPQPTA